MVLQGLLEWCYRVLQYLCNKTESSEYSALQVGCRVHVLAVILSM